jgi:hypothetical protein
LQVWVWDWQEPQSEALTAVAVPYWVTPLTVYVDCEVDTQDAMAVAVAVPQLGQADQAPIWHA